MCFCQLFPVLSTPQICWVLCLPEESLLGHIREHLSFRVHSFRWLGLMPWLGILCSESMSIASLRMRGDTLQHWNCSQCSRLFFKRKSEGNFQVWWQHRSSGCIYASLHWKHEGKPCPQLLPDSGLFLLGGLSQSCCLCLGTQSLHPSLCLTFWLPGLDR